MPKRPLPEPGQAGICYLIHLEEPVAHARHYLGWCKQANGNREAEHRSGNGARLLAVAKDRGIAFRVVRTWPAADRRFERRLKNTANARILCPSCNPDSWARQIPVAGEPRRTPRRKPRETSGRTASQRQER
jgi:hypothetical protein